MGDSRARGEQSGAVTSVLQAGHLIQTSWVGSESQWDSMLSGPPVVSGDPQASEYKLSQQRNLTAFQPYLKEAEMSTVRVWPGVGSDRQGPDGASLEAGAEPHVRTAPGVSGFVHTHPSSLAR